ncbi:MAG TPA: hypothetical protein VFC65_00720 [Prolixibacteraceae bacterium]|nr:hypothetical protein [Prolixibacteraceae bacterium]
MAKKKKKLLFIGPVPLPKGGVSVHIERLSTLMNEFFQINYIDESRNIKGQYFNIRTFNFVKYIRLIANADVIHIHSGIKILRIFHIVFSKIMFKKVVLTLHNSRQFSNKKQYLIEKYLVKYLVDVLLLVNSDLLKLFNFNKSILQHAFIPPIQGIEEKLPENLLKIIKAGKESNKTIIIANAWRLEEYKNRDLYGVDLCIDLSLMLKKNGRKALIVFNVSTLEKYAEKFSFFTKLIEEKGLESNFKLLNEDFSFVKLIELSDIVLRPTLTDGDALTIREAIYLNKPVIASNIVDRPKGTILFETGNIDDLFEKTLSLMDTNYINSKLEHYNINYYKNLYHNIYNEAISTKYQKKDFNN